MSKRKEQHPNRITGHAWMAIRERMYKMNPLCVHCYAKGIYTFWEELDHIVPIHKGGSNDQDNLQGLCKVCHDLKTAKELGYNKVRKIGLNGLPINS
jgi:5-methylcytosine-specific restriction enzyme A